VAKEDLIKLKHFMIICIIWYNKLIKETNTKLICSLAYYLFSIINNIKENLFYFIFVSYKWYTNICDTKSIINDKNMNIVTM